MDRDDKLAEPSTLIDETLKPYYTDTFSPGETKEQLVLGKEVLVLRQARMEARQSFISISTPEVIKFPYAVNAVRIQANYSSGAYTGVCDVTVNLDGTWSGAYTEYNGGQINQKLISSDIPGQIVIGVDFITCIDTRSGVGAQTGRLVSISPGEMSIRWFTSVAIAYNITYIL